MGKEHDEQMTVEALKQQWSFLQAQADSYENRCASIGFAAVGAILAAFIAAIKWLSGLDARTELFILAIVPLCSMVISTWMACNFRKQAIAEEYLKKIEKKLNKLCGAGTYTWMEEYGKIHENKRILMNPKLTFILLCALFYLSINALCLYRVWGLKLRVGWKTGYTVGLVLLSILSYPTFYNGNIRKTKK